MDEEYTFEPEDALAQLIRLRKDVDRIITSLEEALTAPSGAPASPPPPRQATSGILENPYRGLVDDVRGKDIPKRKGGLMRLYEIHTGAAKFTTLDRTTAAQAWQAHLDGCPIQVRWTSRANGRYTNYDVAALWVLNKGDGEPRT